MSAACSTSLPESDSDAIVITGEGVASMIWTRPGR
jgi:hypothetical protein